MSQQPRAVQERDPVPGTNGLLGDRTPPDAPLHVDDVQAAPPRADPAPSPGSHGLTGAVEGIVASLTSTPIRVHAGPPAVAGL